MIAALPARPWCMAILVGVALLAAASAPAGAKSGPVPARQPVGADGQLHIGDGDRCPVCAMYPARRPDAAAALTLVSGETFYFCSNGCLLRAWLRPEIYLGRSGDRIERIIVRDYFSGTPVDGRKATWVAGSDVIGPMGPAIVALDNAGQLETFTKRHGGSTVFTFDRLDDALWKRISKRELPPAQTK